MPDTLTELFARFADDVPDVTAEEVAKYEQHYELLKAWNENMSLVSPKSIETAFATHYVDSMAIADFASEYATGAVYDFGTGAGFPGVVHAIRYPDKPITLFEKSMKKQAFLMAALTQLQLGNVGLEGAIPDAKFSGLFLARAVLPRERLFRFFSVHLEPKSFVVTNLGGQGDVAPLPDFFVKVAEAEYTLPLDCGNRRVELLQFVPRGTHP